ncbi:MAG: 2-succinyl-5-enolpyruvyl-6-hydroxy-3-cyclohexene-1-carboxylic-acid synthase [Chthoniobacterales bacterium]
MSAAETNRRLAAEILTTLHAAGVRTLCVCPGGRNAPLVVAAEAAREAFEVVTFFEERSAAFFALGRIRRDGAPAAVLTTSGTAAAELLPALLEARQAGWPLVAVTADRPRRLRGTGAPQTIDQLPLFAAAQIPVIDLDAPGQLDALPEGPVHLNACFDEPLLDGPVTMTLPPERSTPCAPEPWMDEPEVRDIVGDFFRRVRRPLVLVSSLEDDEARRLAPWLASLSSPLYLEAVSQLRGHRTLQEFSLHAGERILLTPECRTACDGVLRLGGVPTPRFWRECEDWPVLHVSRINLPGLARRDPVVPLSLFAGLAGSFAPAGGETAPLLARDRAAAGHLEKILAAEPRSEAALVRALAATLPPDAHVFLGNSLPIREWDLAAPRTADTRTIHANRGVNGIDGLVSTALGLAGPDRPAAALLGDLSALYDLAGLWPSAQLGAADITLAVINNGGGQIFERLFRQPAFLNAHDLRLRGWAEMFGWHYGTMHAPGQGGPAGTPRLLEVLPDADATARFARAYAALWP